MSSSFGGEEREAQPAEAGQQRREDLRLLRRYHEHGDERARDELIENYLSLVRALASRYANRGEQFEDLVQVGTIGLINAVDRFDISRGVALPTYAVPYIVGEIKRHFRDKGWAVRVPRRLQELSLRLSELVDKLTIELGRSPTVAELAQAAKVDEEDVLEALESASAYRAVSLSTPSTLDDDEAADDRQTALGVVDEGFEATEQRALIAEGLDALDSREREIVQLRFYDELTQTEIAERVGISQMHVSRLLRRSLEKMYQEVDAPPAEQHATAGCSDG